MLSSAKIGTSSWRYYSNSVAKGACEYFLGAGEAPGRWFGRGLTDLGLDTGAVVSERALEGLFGRAVHPVTGEALGRGWRADGVTGFDLTFSAPKSVSLLWALGDARIRHDIQFAHRAAVRAGLDYLDAHAAFSRRGTDGCKQISSGGLVAAIFAHRTSRAGDPQLHTHALILNKLKCADGEWRTIDGHEIYAHKKSAGAVYQAALRSELTQRSGLEFEKRTINAQAEVVGAPKALLSAFSKRTTHIAAEADPVVATFEETLGRQLSRAERAVLVKTAVLKTRPVKEHSDVSALHGRWEAEAAELGWDGSRLVLAVQLAAAQTREPTPGVDDVLTAAVSGAGRRAAVFSRADRLVEIAARMPVYGAPASRLHEQLEALTDAALQRQDAVALGAPCHGACQRRSDTRYASAELLAAEARVLARSDAGLQADFGLVSAPGVQAHTVAASLDPSQTAAVLRATRSGEAITVWTAPAGAGKTTTLGAAARAWIESGHEVVGLAPSARAAAELAAAINQPADTLAKWLHEQKRLAGTAELRTAGWAPTARTVLIVDEAGMASTFDLDQLSDAAGRIGAKVLLVGDPAQIGAVNGTGGMLGALADRNGAATLTELHRFTQQWEREASLRLRSGDPGGLDVYDGNGRIHPAPDQQAALEAAFAQWAAARAGGVDALMMARTRLDVAALNDRARAAAVAAGEITGPAVQRGDHVWQAGDVLLARRNDRSLTIGDTHIRNGDRCAVLAVSDAGLLVQRLSRGGRALLPAAYVTEYAEYGWASTIDGAQGATADVGILLARSGLDREHLYVGITRGRHANHVHVAPGAEEVDDHIRQLRFPFVDSVACGSVLDSAVTRTGAQQTAHQVRDAARHQLDRPWLAVVPEKFDAGRNANIMRPSGQRIVDALHTLEGERERLAARTADLGAAHDLLFQDRAVARVGVGSARDPLGERSQRLQQELGGTRHRLLEVEGEIRLLQRALAARPEPRTGAERSNYERIGRLHAQSPGAGPGGFDRSRRQSPRSIAHHGRLPAPPTQSPARGRSADCVQRPSRGIGR